MKYVLISFFMVFLFSCTENSPQKEYHFYDEPLPVKNNIVEFEKSIGSVKIFLDDEMLHQMDYYNSMTSLYEYKLHCKNGCNTPAFYLRKDKPLPFMHHVVEYWFSPNYECNDSIETYRVFHKFFVTDTILDRICKNDTLEAFDFSEFKSFREFLYRHFAKKTKTNNNVKGITSDQMKYDKYLPNFKDFKDIIEFKKFQGIINLSNCKSSNSKYTYNVIIATDLSNGDSFSANKQMLIGSGFKIYPHNLAIYIEENIHKKNN